MQLAIQQRTQAHVEALAQDFRSNPSPHGLHFFRYDLDHYALRYEKSDFPAVSLQIMSYAQILSKISGRKVIVESMKNLAEYVLSYNGFIKKTTFSDKSAIYVVLDDDICIDEGPDQYSPDYIAEVKKMKGLITTNVSKALGSIGSLVLGASMFGGSYHIQSLSGLYFTAKQRYGIAEANSDGDCLVYALRNDQVAEPMDFTTGRVACGDVNLDALQSAFHVTQNIVGIWLNSRTVANVIPASFSLGGLKQLADTIQEEQLTGKQRMVLNVVQDYIKEMNKRIEKRHIPKVA